jgi:aspartate aminotransferase
LSFVILQAKAILQDQENIDHEYLSITGLPDFTTASPRLIFGPDSPAIKENR